jgi:type III secretory pathway component EscU
MLRHHMPFSDENLQVLTIVFIVINLMILMLSFSRIPSFSWMDVCQAALVMHLHLLRLYICIFLVISVTALEMRQESKVHRVHKSRNHTERESKEYDLQNLT